MREDGRSRRYLAWQAMMAWNSGLTESWSKSKYTARWRRQASVSRSPGPYRPEEAGGGVGVAGVVSTGAAGCSLTFLEQPASAATDSSETSKTRVDLFMALP